jgi:hypothetical protein
LNKIEYLKNALVNTATSVVPIYGDKNWIITAFSVTRQDPEAVHREPYPYKLIVTQWGYEFFDPDNTTPELRVKIDNTKPDVPLFSFTEEIDIDPSWIPSLTKPVKTTIGRLLFNYIALYSSFGTKYPYINEPASVKKIESDIVVKLKDTPSDPKDKDPNFIYVDEYLKFVDALQQYITGLSILCTYSATPKNIVAPPGLKPFKEALLKKYEGKLEDPVVLAQYEKELKEFDDAWLKDDPTYGKLFKGKVKDIARKKMFLGIGMEGSFDTNVGKITPIIQSLEDGMSTDPITFAAQVNGARSGSFSRGADTVKGGTTAKALLRVANSFKIVEKDCETKFGIRRVFNANTINRLIGRYILVNNRTIHIESKEMAQQYIDKPLIVRSPMYCKTPGDKFCKYCAGDKLSKLPNSLGVPSAELSNVILYTFLKRMHIVESTVMRATLGELFS